MTQTRSPIPDGKASDPAQRSQSHRVRELAVEIVIVGTLFVAYVVSRRLVEGSPITARANARSILDAEARLGIDVELRWNHYLVEHDVAADVAAWVYKWLHWSAILVGLVVLWCRDRPRYRVVRDALALAALIGVLCHWLYPVAPPRLLNGFEDIVYGADPFAVGRPPGGSNVYAAFPSYHVGWPAAVGVAVAATWSHPARYVTLVPAGVLALSVIATANHYVVDVVGGVTITVVCLMASSLRSATAGRPTGPPRAT